MTAVEHFHRAEHRYVRLWFRADQPWFALFDVFIRLADDAVRFHVHLARWMELVARAGQTAQTMEGEDQQTSNRMEQLRQLMEQNLQKLGEIIENNRLNELSDNMSFPFNDESPSEADPFILRHLQQVMHILAEHLQRLAMEKARAVSFTARTAVEIQLFCQRLLQADEQIAVTFRITAIMA